MSERLAIFRLVSRKTNLNNPTKMNIQELQLEDAIANRDEARNAFRRMLNCKYSHNRSIEQRIEDEYENAKLAVKIARKNLRAVAA